MSDKVAAARERNATPSAISSHETALRELSQAIEHVRALLDEIDRLRERTYLALRQDTDRQIIADSWQYERGYNDAIDATVGRCHAVSRNQRVTYPWLLNVPMDEMLSEQCAAEISSLRRGGERKSSTNFAQGGSNANTDES